MRPDATAKLDSLPTLPIVAFQLGELVHSRHATVQQVVDLLRGDPSTSAKLLRVVNSPYFGIPGGVTDVGRAIPFIGFNTLYQLVLGITVIETLGHRRVTGLWTHAVSAAFTARELAAEIHHADPGSAFTAGLLHDMGKIAQAKLNPASSDYTDHDKLGGALARQWRFPALLAAAIEHHHDVLTPAGRGRLPPNIRTLAEVVAVGNALAHATEDQLLGQSGAPMSDELQALVERQGLSTSAQIRVCDRAKRALETSKIFLSLVA